jgi:uncharacterized membrane protein
MPLVRNVYSGLKQIFVTVLANRTELFTQVGLIEWPRRGAWSIVFVPKQESSELNDSIAEKEGDVMAVFRPISPNITTGYIMYVARADFIPLSMTIEEAARFLISGGLVTPERNGDAELPGPDGVAIATSPSSSAQ